MTTTTATMTYPSHPQVSAPETATASPILLRRGRSATPFFLHRTPAFEVRSTASMSHLLQVKPSAASTRVSAPAVARSSSELGSRKAYWSTNPPLLTDGDHPLSIHMPSKPGVYPRTSYYLSRSPPSTPRVVPLPLPPPPPPPRKALPPVPFPTGPPTPPPEVNSSTSEYCTSRTSARPVSQDTEETIRQLEQLAASLKHMGTSAASAGVLSLCRDRELSTVKIGVSKPATSVRCTAPPTSSVDTARQSTASLAVPHIMVTNASTENLLDELNGASESSASSSRPAKSPAGGKTTEETEELLWVDGYGAWGASEKGKWKASDEEDDEGSPQQAAPCRPEPRTDVAAEKSYIYEPIGAPEFLVGSSSSRTARAAAGYRSRPAKRSIRRARRRRPAPLILANSHQAESDLDMALASVLFFGSPLRRPTAKTTRRPQTAPQPAARDHDHSHGHRHGHSPSNANANANQAQARPRQPTPPSAWLTTRSHPQEAQTPSTEAPPVATPRALQSYPGLPSPPAHAALKGIGAMDVDRHSEPLPAMPRTPAPTAVHVLRGKPELEQGRQVTWWASSASTSASVIGTSSEPNSPRPGHVRPRLKSLKGLFKHWSK